MNQVAILGVGQTPVREHWDISLRDLAVQAGRAAMQDADVSQVDAIYVGNMTSGRIGQQRQLGALVADYLGQWGVEAVKMEAACGSAASAMRQGLLAVSRRRNGSRAGDRRGEIDGIAWQANNGRVGNGR